MVASDSKTEEFATLLSLFDKLAAREPRGDPTHSRSSTNDDSPDIPADLEPIVKRFAGLISSRRPTEDRTLGSSPRPRSKRFSMPCTGSSNLNDMDDNKSPEQFPLGKEFRFTFKLMLHKLYRLDDWADKVKQVLHKSQSDFRPLAETMEALEGKRERRASTTSASPLRSNDAPPRNRCISLRLRSNAFSTPFKRDHGPASPTSRSPTKATMPVPKIPQESGSIRVVKKRCIGRRKSIDGLLGCNTEQKGRSWVYDAAIAAREVPQRPIVTYKAPAFEAEPELVKSRATGFEEQRFHHKHRLSWNGLGDDGCVGPIGSESIPRRRTMSLMPRGVLESKGKVAKRRREL